MSEVNDTPNTPGTYGYDDTKPATVSGSSPAKPLPNTLPHEGDAKSGFEEAKEFVGFRPEPYVADAAVTGGDKRPSWATGHAAYDIHNNATDRRLVLTIDGQNYSGLVAAPGGNKEIAKMLREMADKVEVGQA